MECEGDCINTHGEHSGDVRPYQVLAEDGWNWGEFFYCDNAAEEDARRGFQLILEFTK